MMSEKDIILLKVFGFKSIEKWIKIVDYDYNVSNMGNVRHINKNTNRKLYKDKDGYLCITLKQEGNNIPKKVHRLVAKAFIPIITDKNEIDHIDGNKTNNVVSNLRWCNRKENATAFRTMHKNNKSGHRNISYCDVRKKYCVHKSINGCNKHIGRFDTLEEAIKARDKYSLQ